MRVFLTFNRNSSLGFCICYRPIHIFFQRLCPFSWQSKTRGFCVFHQWVETRREPAPVHQRIWRRRRRRNQRWMLKILLHLCRSFLLTTSQTWLLPMLPLEKQLPPPWWRGCKRFRSNTIYLTRQGIYRRSVDARRWDIWNSDLSMGPMTI